jgi:hypothetical protein
MPKTFLRLVAALLTFCLLTDPSLAVGQSKQQSVIGYSAQKIFSPFWFQALAVNPPFVHPITAEPACEIRRRVGDTWENKEKTSQEVAGDLQLAMSRIQSTNHHLYVHEIIFFGGLAEGRYGLNTVVEDNNRRDLDLSIPYIDDRRPQDRARFIDSLVEALIQIDSRYAKVLFSVDNADRAHFISRSWTLPVYEQQRIFVIHHDSIEIINIGANSHPEYAAIVDQSPRVIRKDLIGAESVTLHSTDALREMAESLRFNQAIADLAIEKAIGTPYETVVRDAVKRLEDSPNVVAFSNRALSMISIDDGRKLAWAFIWAAVNNKLPFEPAALKSSLEQYQWGIESRALAMAWLDLILEHERLTGLEQGRLLDYINDQKFVPYGVSRKQIKSVEEETSALVEDLLNGNKRIANETHRLMFGEFVRSGNHNFKNADIARIKIGRFDPMFQTYKYMRPPLSSERQVEIIREIQNIVLRSVQATGITDIPIFLFGSLAPGWRAFPVLPSDADLYFDIPGAFGNPFNLADAIQEWSKTGSDNLPIGISYQDTPFEVPPKSIPEHGLQLFPLNERTQTYLKTGLLPPRAISDGILSENKTGDASRVYVRSGLLASILTLLAMFSTTPVANISETLFSFDFSQYGTLQLAIDALNIAIIPLLTKFIMDKIIIRQLGNRYSEKKFEFAPFSNLKLWLFGFLSYFWVGWVHTLSHWEVSKYFFDHYVTIFEINQLFTSHISIGGQADPAKTTPGLFVLYRTIGYLSGFIYAFVLWVSKKLTANHATLKRVFQFGISLVSLHLLGEVVLDTFGAGDRDLAIAFRYIELQTSIPTLIPWLAAIIIPVVILWKVAAEYIKDIDSVGSNHEGPPSRRRGHSSWLLFRMRLTAA